MTRFARPPRPWPGSLWFTLDGRASSTPTGAACSPARASPKCRQRRRAHLHGLTRALARQRLSRSSLAVAQIRAHRRQRLRDQVRSPGRHRQVDILLQPLAASHGLTRPRADDPRRKSTWPPSAYTWRRDADQNQAWQSRQAVGQSGTTSVHRGSLPLLIRLSFVSRHPRHELMPGPPTPR